MWSSLSGAAKRASPLWEDFDMVGEGGGGVCAYYIETKNKKEGCLMLDEILTVMLCN